MNDSRSKAWEARRKKYGPRGNSGSYWRGTHASDAVRQRRMLARLVAYVHGADLLTEGQIARVLDTHRLDVRELEDAGREVLDQSPISGHWGANQMMRLNQ